MITSPPSASQTCERQMVGLTSASAAYSAAAEAAAACWRHRGRRWRRLVDGWLLQRGVGVVDGVGRLAADRGGVAAERLAARAESRILVGKAGGLGCFVGVAARLVCGR